MKEKIDIDRLANLLNGFDNKNLTEEERKIENEKIKAAQLEFNQVQKKATTLKENLIKQIDETSLNQGLQDICHALSVEGKMIGLVETVKIDDAADVLKNKSEELQLKDAKNVLVLVTTNPSTSMYLIIDILPVLTDSLSNETNFEFAYSYDDNIHKDDISFSLIISGLK